jgi:hypothetical protein
MALLTNPHCYRSCAASGECGSSRRTERNLLIHAVAVREEQERLMRELQAVYLTMSKEERQAEVALAEEGLYGQLSPTEAFPGEDEWPWWVTLIALPLEEGGQNADSGYC